MSTIAHFRPSFGHSITNGTGAMTGHPRHAGKPSFLHLFAAAAGCWAVAGWGAEPQVTEGFVNAPVADFPVRKVICGSHLLADMTLPYGEVAYDYLA